ncbi:DEAD/DEAH box helicase family protein [Aminivibrio sp.]|uniref:DEAD/DEAH box helicase family protein n=1 Tax=Aminivibrio sp. TaxID=1872489 RepID=UPI00345E9F1B
MLTKYRVRRRPAARPAPLPDRGHGTHPLPDRISTNYKKTGTIEAGGYIWHTTGSGKTLTSFKTARIASALPHIDKVLFVVDRKTGLPDHEGVRPFPEGGRQQQHLHEDTAEAAEDGTAAHHHDYSEAGRLRVEEQRA